MRLPLTCCSSYSVQPCGNQLRLVTTTHKLNLLNSASTYSKSTVCVRLYKGMNQEGQRGTNAAGTQTTKKRVWGCVCVCVCGRAGLNGQWEWSKAARHHVSSFFLNTPPHNQALFFVFRLGHAGPQEAANRSLNHCRQSRHTCRERMFTSPTGGAGRESSLSARMNI